MLFSEEILFILGAVPDPEIPVLSIVDLGIVRGVEVSRGTAAEEPKRVKITITPTYTGCPAMEIIEDDIRKVLNEKGFADIEIHTVLTPAWTTDWISESAKKKLFDYGIAPPLKASEDKNVLLGKAREIICPQCKSGNTEMKSQFGSTACKALYVCLDCKEPFDYFKCI